MEHIADSRADLQIATKAMHIKCMRVRRAGRLGAGVPGDSLLHARSAEAAPLPHASLKSLHKCAILAFQHAACMGGIASANGTCIKILAGRPAIKAWLHRTVEKVLTRNRDAL